ncbi:MAG: Nif3-like dinuclear metal center hexameric protein, partial [Oscillospiraceae bacterium]|nr:Nif3-like dinuclear metal center hexameric protein [Oscillospiraceae bacterium]
YTTVFLSDKVLSKIFNDNVSNALVFSHHPTNWGIQYHGGNYAVEEESVLKLKERHIALYILHHPLDNYGEYSTCKALTDALHIRIEKPAFSCYGALCGIIGTTACANIHELQTQYAKTVGHATSAYAYGDEDLYGQKIAVCPGGGNQMEVVREILDNNIHTLLTGVTLINEHSQEIHAFEKEHRINLLGGTHYSSEKFAPMAICQYFNSLGLDAEFIPDEPDLYDISS